MGMADDGYYDCPVDFWLAKAIKDIKANYGDDVSVGKKNKNLLKFGENPLVGTAKATLMDLPVGEVHETLIATNGITHISSNNAGDTEPVKVEGHTIDGSGNFTFVVQEITLVGQTKTALTTPLARVTRVYNNGTTDLVGIVYVYEDDTVVSGVPQTAAKIHLILTAGKNNSSKCATTISNQDYWIITDFTSQFIEKAAGYAEIHLEIREKGKVFLEKAHISISDGNPNATLKFSPYIIAPKNSDVRLVATADGASTYVGGSINGVLAIVI